MKKISSVIISRMIKTGVITEEEREEYEYAVISILLEIIPIIIFIIIGLEFGSIVNCVFIILPFFFLRKFSGGFHFSNAIVCVFSSTILLLFLLYISYFIRVGIVLDVVMLISGMGICYLGPLDSAERKMNSEEKSSCKQIAILMVFIFMIIYRIMIYNGLMSPAVCLAEGITLTDGLLILGYLKKKEKKIEDY